MNLVVDRIVNDIIICQNIDNKMMFEIDVNTLDFTVHDGDVITLKDGKYFLNKELKAIREQNIKNKFNSLKEN